MGIGDDEVLVGIWQELTGASTPSSLEESARHYNPAM